MTWPSRPAAASCDKVSAIWARPAGSVISVKQFPSLVKPMPSPCAAIATYSWPFRITCAANGACPAILITRCPHCAVHDVEAVVIHVRALAGQGADHRAVRGPAHIPHHRRGPGDQDQEHARAHRMGAQILLGDQVLAFPAVQSITGTALSAAQARTRRANRPARRIR